MKHSILIVDDHGMVGEGLATLVESDHRLRVCALCGTFEAAASHIQTRPPDLAIIDFNLPDRNGLDLFPLLRSRKPPRPGILLTMHKDASIHEAARRLGASAILLKDDASDCLIAEINRLLGLTPVREPEVVLSPRESEVLGLLLEGLSSKEIASRLGIGRRTVETYRERLYLKTGAGNPGELARKAVRLRLRELPGTWGRSLE